MHRPTVLLLFSALILPFALTAQTPKDVRAVAKNGDVTKVAPYLNSASVDTRVETVKQLISLGGPGIIDPLIQATRDKDPEVEIRATDGLVNYYIPGYVKQGIGSSFVRAGNSIRARFSDANDVVVDPFVIVRPDVITALGQLTHTGASLDARANACRAVGILQGRSALPDLYAALQTKDNTVMYEAIVAMRKIGDPAAGPKIVYLLHDFDDRVQGSAIETVGVLRTTEALAALRSIVADPRNAKASRSAMFAIADMPEPVDRDLLRRQLANKDDKIRAAAAEGLGRIGNPADIPDLTQIWQSEDKMLPRLGAAFALVMEGKIELSDDAPLRYLISTLNSAQYHDVAYAYLTEAARRKPVLATLCSAIGDGTRDEKIYLSRVLSVSGDQSSVAYLDKTSRDTDPEVAREGLRAQRSLRARLGI